VTPPPERPWSCAVAAGDQLEDPCTADRPHTACTVRNARPAPLPDTGDGRPLSDEERIPLALHVLGQIVSSYLHFDGEDNEVIRSAIEAGERLLTDVSLPPAPSPSQPEPGTRRHLPDCPLPRLIASCTCPTPPAPPAVPGDRPDPLADLVPLAEDVLDAATDRSGFRNGRLLADAVIDADAQPAHPAPDGEPGSLHLGAEDRFHLWAHINTIHQETEAASFGQSWPIARDHIHEEAACALAYFDPAPPGGYGVADGTAK